MIGYGGNRNKHKNREREKKEKCRCREGCAQRAKWYVFGSQTIPLRIETVPGEKALREKSYGAHHSRVARKRMGIANFSQNPCPTRVWVVVLSFNSVAARSLCAGAALQRELYQWLDLDPYGYVIGTNFLYDSTIEDPDPSQEYVACWAEHCIWLKCDRRRQLTVRKLLEK